MHDDCALTMAVRSQYIIKVLMYVETGDGQPEPHEETEDQQNP
jgi:hypothetical protein